MRDSVSKQKNTLIPLKLELQMVVRHPVLVLGTEPRSSERTVNALNC